MPSPVILPEPRRDADGQPLDDVDAIQLGVPPGEFTPWRPLDAGSDLLFYEGLHGAVVNDEVNLAAVADLMPTPGANRSTPLPKLENDARRSLLSVAAKTFSDPVRSGAGALDELESVLSDLQKEADPGRIVRARTVPRPPRRRA